MSLLLQRLPWLAVGTTMAGMQNPRRTLLMSLGLIMALTLPGGHAQATPVCLGAGLICDHVQSGSDNEECSDLTCSLFGVCDGIGGVESCVAGAGSFCNKSCGGHPESPPTPAWTTPVVTQDGVSLLTDIHASTLDPQPVLLLLTQGPRGDYASVARSLVEANEAMVLVQSARGRDGSGGKPGLYDDAKQDGHDTMTAIESLGLSSGVLATWGQGPLSTAQRLMAPGAPDGYTCQHTTSGFHDLATGLAWSGGVRRVEANAWLEAIGVGHKAAEWDFHPLPEDPYWEDVRLSDEEIAQVRTAGLHITGWYDVALSDTIRYVQRLREDGGDGAKDNQWLVIGPWDQRMDFDEGVFPGSLTEAPLSALEAAWRLQCLYGGAGQLDALKPYHVYVMGSAGLSDAPGHEWRSYDTWPPPHTEVSLHLRTGGVLSVDAATEQESFESYNHDPSNPVPTLGGRHLTLPSGPADQASIEGREDVLSYTLELEEAIEVVGPLAARIYVNSAPGQLHVAVRLTDVHPDGSSRLIASGIAALSGEGSVEMVEVDLGHTAIALGPDHALRLSISGSSAEAFEISPEPMEGQIAIGPDTPSVLLLPVTEGLGGAPGQGIEPGPEADAGSNSQDPADAGSSSGSEDTGSGSGRSFDTGFITPDQDAGSWDSGGEVVAEEPEEIPVTREDDGCGGAPSAGGALWSTLTLAWLTCWSRRRRETAPLDV